ncbi:MAG: alpha-ketoacid dehydrogenase subunit beta [Candidatus Dormiibacterota bacterium]
MPQRTIAEAINNALHEEMARDSRVTILGLDVGKLGGTFHVTAGLQDAFGGDRVIDTPLAEASIIGASLGLAISGLIPVAELQFLSFSAQAFHQIGPQLGRYRQRSRGRYNCPVTIRAPFGAGAGTSELHYDAVEAQFVQSPGIKVVMPANPYDAKGLLLEAIRDPDPVLFCEPARLYGGVRSEVPDGDYTVPFGQCRALRTGSDVTLVAWSAAVELCERAADQLADDGVWATVVDLRTLVPLDVDGLVRAVAHTGRCVVVHEAPLTGGFGAEVVATVVEEASSQLKAPPVRVAAPDIPFPSGSLDQWCLPSVDQIALAAQKLVVS